MRKVEISKGSAPLTVKEIEKIKEVEQLNQLISDGKLKIVISKEEIGMVKSEIIGTNEETPGEFTVLGRLKSAVTSFDLSKELLGDIKSLLEDIKGFVSGVLKMQLILSGEKISGSTDPNVTFDLNTVANTERDLAEITSSSISNPTQEYLLTVQNTSATSDMTLNVKPIAPEFNGQTTPSLLTQVAVPKSSTISRIIKGILVGTDVKFTVSNDQQVTDAQTSNRKVTMTLRKL